MNFLKRTVPLVIAFVMGVLMAMQYYVPINSHRTCLRWYPDGIGLLRGSPCLSALTAYFISTGRGSKGRWKVGDTASFCLFRGYNYLIFGF